MKIRFVREGGWEKSIDLGAGHPARHWELADPYRAPARISATADLSQAIPRRIFELTELRYPEWPRSEHVYVEIGMGLGEEDIIHECARLAQAGERIRELEILAARLATKLHDAEGPAALARGLMGDLRGFGTADDVLETARRAVPREAFDIARKLDG